MCTKYWLNKFVFPGQCHLMSTECGIHLHLHVYGDSYICTPYTSFICGNSTLAPQYNNEKPYPTSTIHCRISHTMFEQGEKVSVSMHWQQNTFTFTFT